MNIMSLRKARINGLVEYVRGLKKPTRKYSVVNGYSYTSGISVRTVREYIRVLVGIGAFESYKPENDRWAEYIRMSQA